MKVLFWVSLSLIFFTYAGYPIWLYFRARFRPHPARPARICPSVTVVLAVWNEEKYLSAKLQNLDALDYPADRLQIVVVSDGSTDETNTYLAAWEKRGRQAVVLPRHFGKATALNHGVAKATGEIVVFTDARQSIATDSLMNLVANFADPTVGCVSGELIISQESSSSSANGFGLYWRVEKKIRHWESLAGSVVGATGSFYAVRRNLLSPLPAETILDDMFIPFQVVRQGQRVIFEPCAVALDRLSNGPRREFRRKVRTLAGNYQLLRLAPWILTRSNPLQLQFICHKLLRLLVPFALAGLLVSSIWLRPDLYRFIFGLQIVFYGLATLSIFRSKFGIVSRLADISLAFVVLNLAAAVAFLYFITGKKAVWAR